MKHPIPSDWDGQTWHCVRIQWPDSLGWDVILMGLLSYAKLGRVWDERTGNVRDTQQTGWEIFTRNNPFVACEDCPDCPDNPDSPTVPESPICSGGSIIVESDNVGQVVTDIQTIPGGIRVFFGPCCWHDLTLFQGEAVTDLPTDADLTPATPVPGDLACRKAAAIARMLNSAGEWGWNNWLGSWLPLWIRGIQNAAGVDMSNWRLTLAYEQLQALFALELFDIWEEAYPALSLQTLVCKWQNVLSSDSLEVTEAEHADMKAILKSNTSGLAEHYLASLMDAIGRSGFEIATKAAETDDTADCACPPEQYLTDFGSDLEWSHVWDFRTSALPPSYTLKGINTQHTLGVGLWSWPMATDDMTQTEIEINLTNNGAVTSSIKRIAMVFQTRGDENWDDSQHSGFNTEDPATFPGGLVLADIIGLVGENPAQAGIWTMQKTVNWTVGGTEPDIMEAALKAYHPPDEGRPAEPQYSCVIIAVGVAGTGDDPFAVV